ncbi:DUF2690 domain-containing protein [Streptomyces sp. ME18-1-4]|uniref:DUF2690 domain-containing protein n=1 Tax=Streptomyces sp. ME18-1-4 TaxID=3028685 RepID=UPI0029BBF5FF|nr:DUF2690 domain-containing protein [Streptomyces sp. ME18-1-4]MDX3246667.1 DUF2690 domain-containing protein [Streptomyces sp. ME18-1-4]
MRIPSVAAKALSVGAAAAALVVGLTGSASAAAYDYEDPISSGCANTAITAQSTGIYVGSTRVGTIELRYSTGCRTVWARVKSTGPYGGATVTRTSDYDWDRCGSLSYNSSMGQYTCYTRMLNDAGVESYAHGSASASNGYNSDEYQTASY